MKVAVCDTKRSEDGRRMLKCWSRGLEACGDVPIPIDGFDEKKMDQCDSLMQIVGTKPTDKNTHLHDRWQIWDYSVRTNKRTIIFETAFFKSTVITNGNRTSGEYKCVGFDEIKNWADYCNADSPPDRFESFGIEVKPWKTDGDIAILVGQTETGLGARDVKLYEWYRQAVAAAKEAGFKVLYRQHPNIGRRPQLFEKDAARLRKYGVDYITNSGKKNVNADVESDMNRVAVCMTWSSNASAEAITGGVPVLVGSTMSQAYPISGGSFANLQRPDRTQWLNDIGYTQWTFDEIASGVCWSHFRPHALKDRLPAHWVMSDPEPRKTPDLQW